MNKFLTTLAALAAVSACTAAAQTGPHNKPIAAAATAIECTIRTTPTRHGMRFEALARGFETAYGEYEFVLTKDDRGGSSDIVQGGGFDLAPGGEQQLGSAELSLERGARYRARLVLSDDEGELCRSERHS
jgi:hypothetical protein